MSPSIWIETCLASICITQLRFANDVFIMKETLGGLNMMLNPSMLTSDVGVLWCWSGNPAPVNAASVSPYGGQTKSSELLEIRGPGS
ncbi:jg16280 [Pararge aegeria aegeria]|uniref:Jg16280 protein n=1 Tax=Pararge aegeria aegeria TaxID=348720 RepID=A0A8S4S1H7_9NEOP|nr:jg16280 [Pararge aegeria aegeria]